MALVDYSSSASNSDDSVHEPPTKRRREDDPKASSSSEAPGLGDAETKAKSGPGGKGRAKDGASDMPPLPSTFHDLYASTVRQSVVDDPSLHQGRKRQTPHVAGNWPSHVYIEWHPTTTQHDLIVQLLDAVEAEVGPEISLTRFLTSDLGAPLPLHISLSRPLTLTTQNKDDFLDRLETTVRSHPTPDFSVHPSGLAWYKSPDSNRLFLILRVATSSLSPSAVGSSTPGTPNPELTGLLRRCNGVAGLFDQQNLYQRSLEDMDVGEAFHLSVAWTFGLPSAKASLASLGVFKQDRFKDVARWEVPVTGVKVKIGNIVHHVPLGGGREGRSSSRRAVDADDGAFKG